MPAQIHLNDRSTFVVDEPCEDVERAYKDALLNGGVFRITNGSGKVHVINAAYVSRIENVTAETAARRLAEAPPRQVP